MFKTYATVGAVSANENITMVGGTISTSDHDALLVLHHGQDLLVEVDLFLGNLGLEEGIEPRTGEKHVFISRPICFGEHGVWVKRLIKTKR